MCACSAPARSEATSRFELSRAGVDVSLVARGAHLAAMRNHGLRLQIDGHEHVARLRCTGQPAELGIQDYVIVALESPPDPGRRRRHAASARTEYHDRDGQQWAALLVFRRRRACISLDDPRQHRSARVSNGALLGPQRAVGCVVFPATEIVAPGVIRHEHGSKLPIGEPLGSRSARIERLHTMLTAAGFDAPVRPISATRSGSSFGATCASTRSAP